jgi:hypothetical protein
MKPTQPIDFRNQNSGWLEINCLAGEYYIIDENQFSLKFTEIEKSDPQRKIIDVYIYARPDGFRGQDVIFFDKFSVVQIWGEERGGSPNYRHCSIGYGRHRWLLGEDEEYRYRNFNPQNLIPPPAIMVGIFDRIRNRFTKMVCVSPKGGQIL